METLRGKLWGVRSRGTSWEPPREGVPTVVSALNRRELVLSTWIQPGERR